MTWKGSSPSTRGRGGRARSKKFSVGAFTQNLFGTGVAITQLQPVISYQLGHGWALSAGDLQFTYDWD